MEEFPENTNNSNLPESDKALSREKQAEKVIEFLNRIGAYDQAQRLLTMTQEEIEKEFPFENLEDFLLRINGIVRDVDIKDRSEDGEGVQLTGFVETVLVPKHEDKEEILKTAYNAIPQLKEREDAQYLLPAVINSVHLFKDGNGRTSRVIHLLLKQNLTPEKLNEELKKALGENGRFDSPDINPGLVSLDIQKIVATRHGVLFEEGKGWTPHVSEGLNGIAAVEKPNSDKAKVFLEIQRNDNMYSFIAAYEYLKNKGYLEKVTADYVGNSLISPLKMESILTDEEWEEILDNYYNLKKEHVDVLVDSFVQPENYKSMDGSTPLKDKFVKDILENYKNNQ